CLPSSPARLPPASPLFPYTTLFRSDGARYEDAYREFKVAYAECASWKILGNLGLASMKLERDGEAIEAIQGYLDGGKDNIDEVEDRKSTRLNSSHVKISYAVFCLKK